MNKINAKRFLKIIDKNMDKIREEAIKIYKENCLIESTDVARISINLDETVKSTISSWQGYSDAVFNEREIIVYKFNQEKNSLENVLGELCYLQDYDEFERWCDKEEESLNWRSYRKFNEGNFNELVERNIDDSLPDFLNELNESIENCKQDLKLIIEI